MTDLKTTVKLNYMKKVTIETVARKVGVSAATVSYALSGKRKISPEVKEKILNFRIAQIKISVLETEILACIL